MLVQIPQALAEHRAGISFKQFFVERVNTTPATEAMVERAVLQLVRDRQVQVIGSDGSQPNVRTALKPDHVLRLPGR